MSQPGDAFQPRPAAEDSIFELLIETLEGLDDSARAQFLKQLFKTLTRLDLTETQSSEYWSRILQRRAEFTTLGKRISWKAALLDVLFSEGQLRVPVLVEYDDFKRLQVDAATDSLTGLYNRRLFDEYLNKELIRAKRYSEQLAVVILDLHKLKEVNDRHGHMRGDDVLKIAAATLRTTLRASDFAFRIGGDEFALLLPRTDSEQAVTLCRRVRSQYEVELLPLNLNIGVTLDFGAAVYPQDGDQRSELLGTADARLYALKASNRPSQRVIPMEPETPPTAGAAPSRFPGPSVSPVKPSAVPSAEARSEHRKWERVSLAGTKAYALLSEAEQKTAKVIDLSYGGVALQLDKPEDLPNQFSAILHVPILPPVRVMLRKAYMLRSVGERSRIGCIFVS
ncbi:MAG TPA: GGDEF domain-containing protein [Verrucomicrobiae bacterium]|nr:GGDEF domain-containing protein [Verrucomicrobiae bacterium]